MACSPERMIPPKIPKSYFSVLKGGGIKAGSVTQGFLYSPLLQNPRYIDGIIRECVKRSRPLLELAPPPPPGQEASPSEDRKHGLGFRV